MNNLILIGMPGAGKSTVGVVLAKKMGYRFVDTDLVIQEKTGKLLSMLLTEHGREGFLRLEDEINADLKCDRSVISPGGSVIYGQQAMAHFSSMGKIIYLKISFDELNKRLGNLKDRGVAMEKGQTLLDLYNERVPLYEKYGDVTIDCDGKSILDVVEEIWTKVGKK